MFREWDRSEKSTSGVSNLPSPRCSGASPHVGVRYWSIGRELEDAPMTSCTPDDQRLRHAVQALAQPALSRSRCTPTSSSSVTSSRRLCSLRSRGPTRGHPRRQRSTSGATGNTCPLLPMYVRTFGHPCTSPRTNVRLYICPSAPKPATIWTAMSKSACVRFSGGGTRWRVEASDNSQRNASLGNWVSSQ